MRGVVVCRACWCLLAKQLHEAKWVESSVGCFDAVILIQRCSCRYSDEQQHGRGLHTELMHTPCVAWGGAYRGANNLAPLTLLQLQADS
jgi:hypothetical protein